MDFAHDRQCNRFGNDRAEVDVDLFPISFFGIRAGVMGTQRYVNLDTLDCTVLNCHGYLGTVYLKPQLLLGG